MTKTILIIIISVTLFGWFFFIIVKNSLKRKLDMLVEQEKRDKEREDRMLEREMANGIDTGNGGSGDDSKKPSAEKAKDKTDSKALEKSAEDTAKNTKDILDEIQKNP